MSHTINLASVLNTKYPVSSAEAQKVYPMIETCILNEQPLNVSFKDVENCTGIFLSGLIGNLYANYLLKVDKFITLIDIVNDENHIELRIEHAKKFALKSERNLALAY